MSVNTCPHGLPSPHWDKAWLYREYVCKNRSITSIARTVHRHRSAVGYFLTKFNIARHPSLRYSLNPHFKYRSGTDRTRGNNKKNKGDKSDRSNSSDPPHGTIHSTYSSHSPNAGMRTCLKCHRQFFSEDKTRLRICDWCKNNSEEWCMSGCLEERNLVLCEVL